MNGTTCFGSLSSNSNISNAVNVANHSLSCSTKPNVNPVNFASFWEAAYVAAIYMSIISVLTIAANIFVLAISIKDPMKTFRTPTAYFLVGIAFADLATAAVVEPCYYYCFFRLYSKGPGHAPTRVTCLTMFKVGQVASGVTMNVSYITVLAFTLAQNAVVAFPMKMAQRVTAKSVLILQILIWIYALAFQTTSALAAQDLLAMKVDFYLHNIAFTILILISYILLFRAFRRKMAFSMQLQSESSRQIKENKTRKVHQERKFLVINLCLIMVLVFTDIPNIAWWFLHLYELVPYALPKSLTVQLVIDCILLTKFLLDPFVYVWRLRKYRTALRQVCCCGCSCCRFAQEETEPQRGSVLTLGPLRRGEQTNSTVTLTSFHTIAD